MQFETSRCKTPSFVASFMKAGLGVLSFYCLALEPGFSQTIFFDFNSPGQYTNNFNPWNDNAGANSGNTCYSENATTGVGGTRGISVFQSVDTTATYTNGNWDFSTNGATILMSVLIKANGQVSGNKVQFGILNTNANGLINNSGVAFETFRVIPNGTSWSLREQYRTTNTLFEPVLGDINYVVGHWYKFVVGMTNTSGTTGNYNAACAVYDYGSDGQSPGTNIVTFSTLRIDSGQEIATNKVVYAALRAEQNAGIDAVDNFLVFTTNSKPVITIPLTNTSVAAGTPASFFALADGPGNIVYAWYTNGILAAGASGPGYATPAVNGSYTSVMVVAANNNGSATNSATITVFTPNVAVVTNLPATNIQTTSANLNGQVLSTGGSAPSITLYYGPADGGTNAVAWSNNVALGIQSGAFSQAISGLTPNTAYYFAAKAVNVAGTSWATPSRGFTTLALTPATMTNLPATSILANGATLNGQVVATGNDPPAVTVYYGPFNGGTNTAAWSNNVPLGTQNGVFSQTVSGLASNTAYFYTAKGVNSAGTSWAVPSQGFTTLSTNPPAPNFAAVLTYHNDNARTGLNASETVLTPANVNTNTFGLLVSWPVDDQIYAQPLVMTNVNIPARGTHNIVIAATVNDTVYAFDADDPTVSAPYWQTNLLVPNSVPPRNSDMTGACGGNYQDFHGNMGIVGTPVIDPTTGTLYVLARTKENGVTFVQRLHALDVATGNERPGSPVIITATYPLAGGGTLTFDPMKQNPRPGLALVNGIVYLGFSSHCDWGPYHGWLIGYSTTNLARVSVYNTTPNGGLGGIWQSGDPPAVDSSGNLYFETGNGTFDPATGSYSETFIRLSTTNGLALADYFTPYNQAALTGSDADVGSGGAMILPDSVGSVAHPHLIVGGSKAGTLYLLDRENLGHYNPAGDTQIVQSITNATGQCYDTPAYFNNTLYMAGTGDRLKAFAISAGLITPTPVAMSPSGFGFAAPSAVVSANGTSNGIVWAVQVDGWGSGLPAILHAYNATNIAQELYNSSQAGVRDNPAGAVKFTVPVVANGKVFVAGQGALSMFGSAIGFVATPVISPNGGTFNNSITVSITDATPGAAIYYTLDNTIPTTSSPLYTGPLMLFNSVAVRAKAFKSGSVASALATATFLNSSAVGTGTGLAGAYYSNQFPTNAFTGLPTLNRTDSTVNFNWGSGSPDASITADHFTVRWTGAVQPQFNEVYTFYTSTDDGVRLYVNGQLIVDHWVDQGTTEWTGSLSNALTAQQKYNIQMDFYENGGGATAMLSWSSPSTAKSIIPQSQLYPVTNQPPVVSVTSPTNGSTYTASASVTINANASESGGTIAKVDFYANNTFLGSISNGPYANTAIGLNAGSYALTARATDGTGITVTSAPVNITVTAGSGQAYGLPGRVPVAPYLNMPSTNGGPFPARLSLTGAFSDTANLNPASGLIPYTVNVPLWSDGAVKTRWLSVPNGGVPYTPDEQIWFASAGEWMFPAGTVFVKHFDLVTDETQPTIKRRLETRLLVRDSGGAVYGVTYKWRPDNSDADLLSSSLSEDIVVTNAAGTRTQTWYYPSPADCLTCHTPAANYVLGVKTRQLNGSFTYSSTGVTDNQLRTLNRMGLLYPAFNETNIATYAHLSPLTNLTASPEDRTRSYLDANCAQCHRPGGTGPTFDARYDTPLASQNIINGLLQKGDLGYDNARVVVPKDVWRSVLYGRMNTTDPSIKMPQLARNLIDTNAVAVIADWINILSGTPALAPPSMSPSGGSFLFSVIVTLQHPDPSAAIRYTLDGTLPTTNSTLYTGPLTLSSTATLKAKAFEAGFNDSVATTALFSIRPPVFFTSVSRFTNSQFQMQLSGIAGKSYVLQSTPDLTNWTSLSTNVAPSNIFELADPVAGNFQRRYYRAVELP